MDLTVISGTQFIVDASVLKASPWAPYDILPLFICKPSTQSLGLLLLFFAGIVFVLYLVSRFRGRNTWEFQDRIDLEVRIKTAQLTRELEKLKAINSSKDRLLTIIAHDLRTSAISLGKLSEKIRFLLKENRMEDVILLGDSLNRNANNLLDLLDNLLTWSLQQQNQVSYKPEKLELKPMLENVIDLYRDMVEAKRIRFLLEVDAQSFAFADPNSMKTVFRNIISNAIKYSFPDSKIIVISAETGSRIILSVSDSGKGMNARQIEELMSGDFMSGTAGTSGEKGTGLGLFISKQLLEQNKGTMTITSAEAAGTRVDINLPKYLPEYSNPERKNNAA